MTLVAAVVAVAACGSSSPSAQGPHAARCSKPPPGIGPDAAATLEDADTGGTFCLHDGDILTVFLHAPVDEPRWSNVAPDPSGVLVPQSTGIMTLPRGVTAAVLAARQAGTVELTSTRPCETQPPATCSGPREWHARVVVR